ncbi:hypothetical protein ANN_23029 [Periplaneta americana]|uniref:Uncharacterized protein n=1 Tax=Periplaneta americana TaxID=6978 RepID=A0ABQ8SLD0_PERAM|nr:hypothetical protein ANN_23029 [Periplaneta americana]
MQELEGEEDEEEETKRDSCWKEVLKSNIPDWSRKDTVVSFHMTTGHDCLTNHLFCVGILNRPSCIMDSEHQSVSSALSNSTTIERYWEARNRMLSLSLYILHPDLMGEGGELDPTMGGGQAWGSSRTTVSHIVFLVVWKRRPDGHDCLAKHLHRIGIYQSPNCPLCNSNQELDSEHLKICASVAGHDNIFEKYWSARGQMTLLSNVWH